MVKGGFRMILVVGLVAAACSGGDAASTDLSTAPKSASTQPAMIVATTTTIFHPGLGLSDAEVAFYQAMVEVGVFPPFDVENLAHAVHTGATGYVDTLVNFLEAQMRSGQWGTCEDIHNEVLNGMAVLSDDYSGEDALALVLYGPLF